MYAMLQAAAYFWYIHTAKENHNLERQGFCFKSKEKEPPCETG